MYIAFSGLFIKTIKLQKRFITGSLTEILTFRCCLIKEDFHIHSHHLF